MENAAARRRPAAKRQISVRKITLWHIADDHAWGKRASRLNRNSRACAWWAQPESDSTQRNHFTLYVIPV